MPHETSGTCDAKAVPSPDVLTARHGPFQRLLRVFAEIEPREAPGVLLLAGNAFLLLLSYYILKTVREPLILQSGRYGLSGEELKTYATAGQAILLLGMVPLYCRIARSINRLRLIRRTIAFLVISLLLFAGLGYLQVPIGVPYYLWLGAVSLIAIAQFWSFANDYYRRSQGERLFPFIAVGAALGAAVGAAAARWLLETVGLLQLMLVAAGALVAYAAIFSVVERLEHEAGPASANAGLPVGGRDGFVLVLRSRYLLLIAITVLLSNLVNTQGEYVMASAVNDHAEQLVPGRAAPESLPQAEREQLLAERRVAVGKIYGNFYSAVNLLALLIQLFLVSPLFKHLGIHRTLFVFPLIALAAYGSMFALPAFMLIAAAKTVENSTDYSLHNTVRHALFLPTTRDAKYKAKAAIDAFFQRFGDLVAGATVFAGIHILKLSAREFALSNMALIALWVAIVGVLARHYRRLSAETAPAVGPSSESPTARLTAPQRQPALS
jgi:ATP:ADP antiporter, AAA family